MDTLSLRTGIHGSSINPSISRNSQPKPSRFSAGAHAGRRVSVGVIAAEKGSGGVKTTSSRFTIKHPFRSLLIDYKANKQRNDEELGGDSAFSGNEDDGLCDCEYDDDDDDDNHTVFDRNSFSNLLKWVSLTDAELFAQMSYLGNLAYSIPNIKAKHLLKRCGPYRCRRLWRYRFRRFLRYFLRRYFGLRYVISSMKSEDCLRYVTSSIEKREQLASADKKEQLANAEQETGPLKAAKSEDDKNEGFRINPLAAFQIASSVASFLNARARNIFRQKGDKEHISEMASSFMSNTDSVTAVVAAKEEVKQAVADDLNSVRSTPCEWYICDDDKTATRFCVIQGSETLASWKANLLFEPIRFEGFDTFVHRGIYEAAKGIYQQMLPEIRAHMKAHGKRAKLRFTGHSLGGSLSVLINLMLLIRHEVPRSSLLPVITFGSPTIMCGGDQLLRKLDLPRSHIQAVTMHRDIVPRAFSCNYPNRVAKLLKAVNRNFRNHPCLNKQNILYAPMGELIILQPDSSYSPQHDLLPSGSGLYNLNSSYSDTKKAEKNLRAAKLRFLNSPHPLEILRDRSAYGSGGAIQRDHDMNSYVKCVRSVIRQLRKAERERRWNSWWAHVLLRVSRVLRTGIESLKRFGKISTSKSLHLLALLLVPARFLLGGAFGFTGGFRLR